MGFLVGRRLNGNASPLRRGISRGSEWFLEHVGLGSVLRERGGGALHLDACTRLLGHWALLGLAGVGAGG